MRLAITGFTCIKIHKTEFFMRSNILLVNCACICVTDGQCSMKLLKTCKFEYVRFFSIVREIIFLQEQHRPQQMQQHQQQKQQQQYQQQQQQQQ